MRVIPLRPVVLPWDCHRSGDCCRSVDNVVMTTQERDVLLERRPDLRGHFEAFGTFVALRAKPCPLLAQDAQGLATCTVHDIRPYNCRRFGCYRPDPTVEPYEGEPFDLDRTRLGCANLSDRIALSRPVRRDYARRQRKAQRWAMAHGWRE